jgi:hypothetical protein
MVSLVVILLILDFLGRFTENANRTRVTETMTHKGSVLPARMLPEDKSIMLAAYQRLDPNGNLDGKNKQSTQAGLSLQEQSQQQGLLDEFYAGNSIISLKAVIDDEAIKESQFALLQVQNIEDNVAQIIRVVNQDEFKGYKVTALNLSRIKFTSLDDASRYITLSLYSATQTLADKTKNTSSGKE